MCKAPKIQPRTPTPFAAPQSDAAMRAAQAESLARRRQGGVAGDILTSPLGLPATAAS